MSESPPQEKPDLSQARLEKELEKLTAEVEKLRAETRSLSHGQVRFWLERMGPIVLAMATIGAVFTTCQKAEIESQKAQLAKDSAALVSKQAELETAQAKDLVKTAHDQTAAAVGERDTVLKSLASAKDDLAKIKATYEAARGKLAGLCGGDSTAKQKVTASFASIGTQLETTTDSLRSATPGKGRVLVFPAYAAQSAAATKLHAALQTNDFRPTLKPIVKRPDLAPEQTEVRYFRKSDAELAKSIVELLRKDGERAVPSPVDDPEITFPHYFEVHFATTKGGGL